MKRASSFTEPDQGEEGTCTLHMISRLFVHNIVKPDICPLEYKGRTIPPHEGEFTSECSFLLKTEGRPSFAKLNPHTCGGIRKYFSTLMYLYAYYSIVEEKPDSLCEGGYAHENFSIVRTAVQNKTIPSLLEPYARDIHLILDILPDMYFTTLKVELPPKKSSSIWAFSGIDGYRAHLFMKLCTLHHLYMGAFIQKKKTDGHSIVLSKYDWEERTVTFKNSWGNGEDVVPINKFKGPHYTLGKQNIEDVDITSPLRYLFYMGETPLQTMYAASNRDIHETSPVRLLNVTRSAARKVGTSRTSHIRRQTRARF